MTTQKKQNLKKLAGICLCLSSLITTLAAQAGETIPSNHLDNGRYREQGLRVKFIDVNEQEAEFIDFEVPIIDVTLNSEREEADTGWVMVDNPSPIKVNQVISSINDVPSLACISTHLEDLAT